MFYAIKTTERRGRAVAVRRGAALTIAAAAFLWAFGSAAAASAPKIVLILGDSIAAGHGIDPSRAFPALIQESVEAKHWNFKVVNAGQSGDSSAGGLARLDWLLRSPIDVLVLELGANDGLRGLPVAVTKKNLQAIIDRTRAKYPGVKIVIAGMMAPANMGADYTRRFERMFRDLQKRNNAYLIPFILKGVGGVARLNLPDGIHPTAEGHAIVAANVWKVLEPVLRSLR